MCQAIVWSKPRKKIAKTRREKTTMFSVPINGPDPIYDDTFCVYPPSVTREELEKIVVLERLDLYNQMKPCGAKAMRTHLQSLGVENLPSISTISRILSQQQLTDRRMAFSPGD
jgi:hypothetical protein